MLGKNRRVVVITGASGGLGRACARAFARDGASVALLARNFEALENAAAEARQLGARALPIAVDVADADALEAAADRVEAELGPIDVWVNNAMVTVVCPIASLPAAELRRVTEVTYLGAVHGTLAALRRMQPRNRGSIVQVGSALAYRAIPLQSAYCGAKFALRGFTDSLRCELAHTGSRVRVCMVQMPALNTPQFDWCRTHMPRRPRPVAPIFEPEVAARAITWASRHRVRELYVGFSTMGSIWINKLVPRLLDRYLSRTGYESQLSPEPVSPGRRDNLWDTVAEDHGARGRFGAETHRNSLGLWLRLHRGALAAGALTLAVASVAIAGVKRR